ncbi:hypothetical protein KOR34_20150 [Posidoniimonas corsicana]|uniref:Uncharacterized protein n=1 Tax=Posidoniimonas corsicana TaxID=1938618 RepID=A0A5C5VEL1_9BACT|nr:hypothetical protein [Posidoniimonas corsicana]TWT37068.1 hypothetical protein KOR34_20150 [Posidoniimonas corsicana]
MVAEKTIRCAVVCVDAEMTGMNVPDQSRFRPSDLVPWADPYIASLVRKLQREVREEREAISSANEAAPCDLPLGRWEPLDWEGEASSAVLDF